MRRRVRKTVEGGYKVRVVTIGASEVGRLRQEVIRRGEGKIVMEEHVRVRGKLDRKEGERVEEEMEKLDISPDIILIGGPGNSIVENGGRGGKGRGAEMLVTVSKDQRGKVEKVNGEFHLREPVRPTMCERKMVAGAVGRLVRKCGELWPFAEVFYLEIYPRHVVKCCGDRDHMCEEDVQVIDRSRRDMEEEVGCELRRVGVKVRRVQWWVALGMEEEPSLESIRRRGVVGSDGVHMNTTDMKRVAALFCRMVIENEGEPINKRRRESV
jgi:hypothetical protein